MAVQVKGLTQTRAGGIHVSLEPRGKVSREEAYFSFELTWLGKAHQADVTAERYMARYSEGEHLTEWRVIVRSRHGDLTDAARRAADKLIEPIVTAWLDSPEYVTARQRAYAHAIARAISEERYDASRARRVFDLHRHELSPVDAMRLGGSAGACDLLEMLLDRLKDEVKS